MGKGLRFWGKDLSKTCFWHDKSISIEFNQYRRSICGSTWRIVCSYCGNGFNKGGIIIITLQFTYNTCFHLVKVALLEWVCSGKNNKKNNCTQSKNSISSFRCSNIIQSCTEMTLFAKNQDIKNSFGSCESCDAIANATGTHQNIRYI